MLSVLRRWSRLPVALLLSLALALGLGLVLPGIANASSGLTADKSVVAPGDTVTFNFTATSPEDSDFANVYVSSAGGTLGTRINSFTTFVSCSGNKLTRCRNAGGDYLAQTPGAIGRGETYSGTLTVRINPDTPGGTFQTQSRIETVSGAEAWTPGPLITVKGPTAVTATSGNNQSTPAGTAFPNLLVATVTDAANQPVPNAPVTFAVTGGSASFPGGASAMVNTDTNGRATSPTLTAGSTVGPVTVTASTPGVANAATFTETVTAPGPPGSDLSAAIAAPATAVAGAPFSVTLTVRNGGTDPASQVASQIKVPAGLTVTDAGGGKIGDGGRSAGFVTGSVAPGQTVTFTVKVTAGASVRGAQAITGSTASALTRDVNLANNTAQTSTTVNAR